MNKKSEEMVKFDIAKDSYEETIYTWVINKSGWYTVNGARRYYTKGEKIIIRKKVADEPPRRD